MIAPVRIRMTRSSVTDAHTPLNCGAFPIRVSRTVTALFDYATVSKGWRFASSVLGAKLNGLLTLQALQMGVVEDIIQRANWLI
jgi:hypothetical protein